MHKLLVSRAKRIWLTNFALTITSALVMLIASNAAAQAAPELVKYGNRWLITAYDDTSPVHQQHATQGLCFKYIGTVGTHMRYIWWSDTFHDWNGTASQEGDQIFMYGDYADDTGHDGMQWSIVTSSPNNIGAGHWREWREDGNFGKTIGFGNAKFERVGYCKISIDEAKYIETEKDISGVVPVNPLAPQDNDELRQ
ncbi:MAG: hypothetical protein JW841_03180 [Deltaproteobacteria bacterium]|nr:hypothetical protein [Deltaproteobacteria bacterium]